jgi:hypothetical protein
MMQMAMADRQFQQSQTQQERMYEQQVIRDQISAQRADAYDRALTEPRPTGPTELERNYGFLENKYPGQDVGGMILPNLKPGQGSEGYQYDLDPTSAASVEKEFGLPPGTTAQMGPRQREDAYTQYQGRRFPKPDTSVPVGQTPAGRQLAYLNTFLQDYEQRRSSTESRGGEDRRYDPSTFDEAGYRSAVSSIESKIKVARGALSRITATGQPIPESEWKAIDEQLIGGATSGDSQELQELAQELGLPVELVKKMLSQGIAEGKIK